MSGRVLLLHWIKIISPTSCLIAAIIITILTVITIVAIVTIIKTTLHLYVESAMDNIKPFAIWLHSK